MAFLTALPSFSSTTNSNLDGALQHTGHHPGEELGSPEFWWQIIISTFLILSGGVFAGCVDIVPTSGRHSALIAPRYFLHDVRLTLGLMGLDELHLRVLSTSSDDETERKNAAKGAYQTRSGWAVGDL
jgi:metal transporter CNNM